MAVIGDAPERVKALVAALQRRCEGHSHADVYAAVANLLGIAAWEASDGDFGEAVDTITTIAADAVRILQINRGSRPANES